VPPPTIPAQTLYQSSLDELVREICQEVNEVSFYVQKSQAIYLKDVFIVLCMSYKLEKKRRKAEE